VPEARFDPLGRRWVLLAPERASRDVQEPPPDDPDPAPCRFCEGEEAQTPPEVYAIRKHGTAPDSPGWRVRVVPNLYPATAAHEVVVHSPYHDVMFEDLVHGRRRAVILAYRARLRELDLASVVIVWNRGRVAGASRSHHHGQIFGLDRVPPTLERETLALADDPCMLCRMSDDGTLRIAETERAVVLANPVPLVAHELLVVPLAHQGSVRDVETEALGGIADAIADAVLALRRGLIDRVPFNLVVHCAPRGVDRFHWHAHLYPRLATWGGLELGTEVPVVAADPQETARRLRET
jgi:UDPglucose--hexose-1-phosphate uridylyltransferase